jgi:hypothetical protein
MNPPGALLLAVLVLAQAGALRPAVPVDAATGILDAFRSRAVVAIGDGREHGDTEFLAFVRALVRDPRFASAANDIVLECCNARYQESIDRYVRGDAVLEPALAPAWQNTTQVNAHQRDGGTALELFRTVRQVNASLPRDRQLRVLFGDPPIDWDTVETAADHRRFLEQRDTFPAELIQREVLARGRKALVVYGGMHLQRKNLIANYESGGLAATVISHLETIGRTRAFTIWPAAEPQKFQADVSAWPSPSLALLRGTQLGAPDFADYYGPGLPRIRLVDGRPDFSSRPLAREEWRTLRMEDQFDAVLYLGPSVTIASVNQLTPDMCTDTVFMPILRARMALVNLKPEIDRLNRFCAAVAK